MAACMVAVLDEDVDKNYTSLNDAIYFVGDSSRLQIAPGRFDNTNWTIIKQVYDGTTFTIDDDDDLPKPISRLQRLCRSKHSTDSFTIQFDSVHQNCLELTNQKVWNKVALYLGSQDHKTRHLTILRMQISLEYLHSRYKQKQQMMSLKKLATKLKVKLLRKLYFVSIKYHHHTDKAAIRRAVHHIIKKTQLPPNIKEAIASKVKLSTKKAVRPSFPAYINSPRFISKMLDTPWPHSPRCLDTSQELPRRPTSAAQPTQCICFNPLQALALC